MDEITILVLTIKLINVRVMLILYKRAYAGYFLVSSEHFPDARMRFVNKYVAIASVYLWD